MQSYEKTLNSYEQTEQFAASVAKLVTAPCSIALQGDLGAGKTTFARGFLHAFGHKGKVKSPTYTIIEPYGLGDLTVNHFDLYRLADPDELELIGADEMFNEQSINLIEWPEQGEGWLPALDLWLKIKHLEHGRQFSLTASSDKGQFILDKLEQ